jgi:hypothetical protein
MSFARPAPLTRDEKIEARQAVRPPDTVKTDKVGRYGVGEVRPMAPQAKVAQKQPTFRSASWLEAVRSLECCVRCGKHGVQAAHRNEGKGMALKAPDCACAALCPECHAEIDSGRTMTKERKRAELDRCIVLTVIALAQAGKVRVT